MVTIQIELTSQGNEAIGLKDAAVMRLADLGTVEILDCVQWTPKQMLLGEEGK